MEKFLGKYQLKEEIGRGAMGSVYLAFDPVLERDVAIKTISSTIRDKHLKERFIREARAAGKLRHNNIVTIYDFGVEQERLYIAMEYLEGHDLAHLIAERVPMDIKTKLEIIRQICLALDYAHQNEIFHRDIKPANIRLLKDGSVKIVDFGLAVMQSSSLTQSGAFLGTPNYVGPERLQGESGEGRSDQFAVGIVLYELLTYRRAFEGENIPTIIYNVLNAEPRGLDPVLTAQFPELEHIIRKAIQKDPDLRYPSMKAMADDIQILLEKMKKLGCTVSEPIGVMDEQMETVLTDTAAVKRTTVGTTIFESGKKPRLAWIAAAFAVLLLVLTLGYLIIFKKSPPAAVPGTASSASQALQSQQGFLAFDAKPYAVITEIVNIDTGESVPLPSEDGAAVTPLRLTLEPGQYKIVYSFPQSSREHRSRIITVTAGKTTVERDSLNERFIREAVGHFTVSGNNE